MDIGGCNNRDHMKKKILIGSIGITSILILISFSSVVTAHSTKQSIQLQIENIVENIQKEPRDGWFPGYLFIKLYEYLKENDIFPLIQILALLIGAFININAYFVESGQWFIGFYPVILLKILYGFIQNEYWYPGVLIVAFFQFLNHDKWFPGQIIYILSFLLISIFITGLMYYS